MFRLAAAFVAALISATLAPPAGKAVPVVMQPVFTLSSPSTPAGSPETFVITRVAGGAGVYVLFQTSDGTAKAGVDYTATKQLIYLKGSTKTVPVSVPTFINSGSAVPLTLSAAIANTAIPVRAIGTIVEPTQTCPDGSIIAAAGICPAPPPPATQTCADGSVVPASSTCPPPPAPAPQWVLAPLTNGGYARCKNPSGCRSDSAPCPQGLNPPAVCSYPDVIAQFGDVWMYAWNGWSASTPTDAGHAIGAFWPTGQYKVARVGVEGPASDWEGVVPSP